MTAALAGRICEFLQVMAKPGTFSNSIQGYRVDHAGSSDETTPWLGGDTPRISDDHRNGVAVGALVASRDAEVQNGTNEHAAAEQRQHPSAGQGCSIAGRQRSRGAAQTRAVDDLLDA
jgi:hypothetical protein